MSTRLRSAISIARIWSGAQSCEFVCDLATTCDQVFLGSPISVFIADGIENRSSIGKKVAKLGDHQALEIAGRDPPSL